jgi:hypothetical protein
MKGNAWRWWERASSIAIPASLLPHSCLAPASLRLLYRHTCLTATLAHTGSVAPLSPYLPILIRVGMWGGGDGGRQSRWPRAGACSCTGTASHAMTRWPTPSPPLTWCAYGSTQALFWPIFTEDSTKALLWPIFTQGSTKALLWPIFTQGSTKALLWPIFTQGSTKALLWPSPPLTWCAPQQ